MAYIGKIPAPAAITASDLDPAVITGQTALAVAPADTDEFLISDAGVLKRLDASLVGGGSMTKIANADYSSAVSNFTYTDCFTSDYSVYRFYMYDIDMAATNSQLQVKFLDSSSNILSQWRQQSLKNYHQRAGTSAGEGHHSFNGNNFISLSDDDNNANTSDSSYLEMDIVLPYESKYTTVFYKFYLSADNGYNYIHDAAFAFLSDTTSVRSMTIFNDAGTNFASYKSTLYGLTR